MIRHLGWIAFCCVLTVVGLVGGWQAAMQTERLGAAAAHEEAGTDGGPEALDARTLANLGVTVGPARKSDFTRYRPVQAVVVDRPSNLQPVEAPLGGIVTAVHAAAGGVAPAGGPLVEISRDPIARPKPELTADVLTPISEEVHEAVSSLRSALGRLAIVDRNLARVRAAGNGGTDGVPFLRKSEIEFENERARILVERDSAHHELALHGLTEAEIQAIEKGAPAPANPHLWQHALRRHGLWPKAADAIRAAVPDEQRTLPWCVAAIGELSAAGLATDELAEALKSDPALAGRFAEAAGLLLQGTPLATVQLLAAQGALEPRILIRAPGHVDRWDVRDVAVRMGQRVDAGDTLVRLHDARVMWLRLEPVGEEIGHVARALVEETPVTATPLVANSGPALEDLRLSRFATHAEEGERGGNAFAVVTNEPLCAPGEDSACSWALRVGLRYLVKVPVELLTDRFVLPAGAIASRGRGRVVFLQDGASFVAVPVHVEHEDHEVIVIADDGGLFEGDPVVMSGAFSLSLALQVESAAADPHAGHNH